MSVNITNVLLLDNVDPSAKDILEKNNIKAKLSTEKLSPDALVAELQNYDGMVVRSATKVTSDMIEKCPNLKIIGRAGVGVDNVDIKSATKHGIIVMNTPSGNTLSAAEHTCTLICCLARNVPAADASMKAGKWDRKAFMGHELYGKTLGVIGLGRIGREAAIRMQSFGMTTIGFDPIVSKEEAAESNIEWLTVEEIWPRADYITVHTPLIPQTKGLLNDASFAKCKKGVRVINCARGGIIDEDALLRALQSGQCGGAGLDVYVEEPTHNTALVNHPKVVACPHLGASTKEGQARCGKEIAEQFVDVASGKSFFGVLNAPALSQAAGLGGYVSAMRGIGKILKSFFSNLEQVNLELNGDCLAKASNCMKAAFCAGYLDSSSNDINLINASALATEIGLNVTCSHKKEGVLATSVSVQAVHESGSLRLTAGVVDGKGALLAIDDQAFPVAMPLVGKLLLFKASPSDVSNAMASLYGCGIAVTSFSATPASGDAQWVAMATSSLASKDNIQSIKAASHAIVQF